MKKAEVIERVAGKSGLKKTDAARAVNSLLETIGEVLTEGGKVSFSGFGSFEVIKKAARKGRSPLNGETLTIPERKAPKFKPGITLKKMIAAGK